MKDEIENILKEGSLEVDDNYGLCYFCKNDRRTRMYVKNEKVMWYVCVECLGYDPFQKKLDLFMEGVEQ